MKKFINIFNLLCFDLIIYKSIMSNLWLKSLSRQIKIVYLEAPDRKDERDKSNQKLDKEVFCLGYY